ncbi:hypothetical protein ACERK3_12240 [Phycisphaerales bacterium AB-hyl4]|uniref:Uncharacterized protein n=1 Tax=Natronomicrosphaera hydrolytica TaxID=3242702 RepID=A0ABV4U629_9BACT
MAADQTSLSPEVTVWADARSAAGVMAVLDRMGSAVRPIGVGGPREPGVASDAGVDRLAATLDCARNDDLRKLLVDRPAAFLLLATMRDASVADVQSAVRQGMIVLALEPVVEELAELKTLNRADRSAGAGVGRILPVPAFDSSPGYLSAAEPGDAMGEARTLHYESLGTSAEGSLYARLLDGWRTVLAFSSMPVTIDASLAAADDELVGRARTASLRDMGGALTAHGRMDDGSSALLHIADRSAETRRALHVLGREGQLRVDDVSYSLRQITGELLDEARPESGATFADLVAWQWRRLIDRLDGVLPDPPSPGYENNALACCLACLLSIRTGQPESPAKLAEIGR